MSESRSLQGLCTVCYAEQPKYRCPRCKTQTCSLPCYKRHQQRAACSGQRNPAEFVKKSQWATPNGIDRDYNYLKSVERNIERAGEDIKPRIEEGKQKHGRQTHSESNLSRYMQQNRIIVNRAPAGMSRARANKTRVTQSGKIYWTIAWSDETGKEFVDEDCPESSKLVDLYASAMTKRARGSRQRAPDDAIEHTTKRRRVEEVSDQSKAEVSVTEQHSTNTPSTQQNHDAVEVEAATTHFYLLRPGNTDAKILIPLQAQQSLTTALREKTVQEFPTIYALPYAAEQLPAAFILEATFLARRKPDSVVYQSKGVADETTSQRPPDAAQILEMLRRDVHTT